MNTEFNNNKSYFEQFINDLRQGMNYKQALGWYTKETAVHKIFNNILRSGRHPTEIFYIQPFF